jgi:hypothetical protein
MAALHVGRVDGSVNVARWNFWAWNTSRVWTVVEGQPMGIPIDGGSGADSADAGKIRYIGVRNLDLHRAQKAPHGLKESDL